MMAVKKDAQTVEATVWKTEAKRDAMMADCLVVPMVACLDAPWVGTTVSTMVDSTAACLDVLWAGRMASSMAAYWDATKVDCLADKRVSTKVALKDVLKADVTVH